MITGVSYPVCATRTESSGTVTYSDGFVIGGAVSVSVAPTVADNTFHADNIPWVTDKSVSSGTISLSVSGISMANEAKVLGHTYTEATTTPTASPAKITRKAGDYAPNLGFGYIVRSTEKNSSGNASDEFLAVWFNNVVFGEPTEESNTQEESKTYNAVPFELNYAPNPDGEIGEKASFETEAEAKAYIDTIAGISSVG